MNALADVLRRTMDYRLSSLGAGTLARIFDLRDMVKDRDNKTKFRAVVGESNIHITFHGSVFRSEITLRLVSNRVGGSVTFINEIDNNTESYLERLGFCRWEIMDALVDCILTKIDEIQPPLPLAISMLRHEEARKVCLYIDEAAEDGNDVLERMQFFAYVNMSDNVRRVVAVVNSPDHRRIVTMQNPLTEAALKEVVSVLEASGLSSAVLHGNPDEMKNLVDVLGI